MNRRRLRIRGRLNLLIVLPLGALVVIASPFVAGQIATTQAAVATAHAATDARQLGELIWHLQHERLATAAYLASPLVSELDLLLAQQEVDQNAAQLRASWGDQASPGEAAALVRVGSLVEVRRAALAREATVDSVARTYQALIDRLIQALELVRQTNADANGVRQLTSLDTLLRVNEHSAMRAVGVIAAAVAPQASLSLLDESTIQTRLLTDRYLDQADSAQASLLILVDQGQTARRLDELATALPERGDPVALAGFVSDVLAAAIAQADLRRLVQDEVSHQVTEAAGQRVTAARQVAWTVGAGTVLMTGIVLVLVVVIRRSIARPLRRLTRAAREIAELTDAELAQVVDSDGDANAPPSRLMTISAAPGDELGDLAVAFNRVQTTAASLVLRQTVTRRNVAQMFSNVAQRTRNLVDQQIGVIDELERNEQNPHLLGRLYRLDHLSTRLRRTTKNLLVVAGAATPAGSGGPMPLATVLRAALTEIEEYQRIRVGEIADVTVSAGAAADLVLLFAELFENAAMFSPPESSVELRAEVTDGWGCRVLIVDHGIGMGDTRLEQENRRLVERERLDVAPTSVLGLFVVGRLARRHGATVTLVSTNPHGITAQVDLPAGLMTSAIPAWLAAPGTAVAPPRRAVGTARPQFAVAAAAPSPAPAATQRGVAAGPIAAWPAAVASPAAPFTFPLPTWPAPGGFAWFDRASRVGGGPSAPPARHGSFGQGPTQPWPGIDRQAGGDMRGGTVPETHTRESPTAGSPTAGSPNTGSPTAGSPNTGSPAAGLVRRVPGAQLPEGVRDSAAAARPAAGPRRDPDADRAKFDGYAMGFARGQQQDAAPNPGGETP